MRKKIIVVSDFDGTITTKDSLVAVLDEFTGKKWHRIARLVHEGKMGTRVGLRKEFTLCKITRKQLIDFLNRRIRIDGTFKKFLGFCRKNRIPFMVVSGGFALCVKTVFEKFNIQRIKYYGNIVSFNGKDISIEYPYENRHCYKCGTCKTNFIRKLKKQGYYILYVGDSVTDRCPAGHADLSFAKWDLADYCRKNKIPYIPYKHFSDIQKYIKATQC